jgi:hypothetical protein
MPKNGTIVERRYFLWVRPEAIEREYQGAERRIERVSKVGSWQNN